MKFVDVTYGTKGDTERYTYAVNNSVRVGDILQVSVKHHTSKKIFGTTAIAQKTASENTAVGQEMKQKAEEDSEDGQVAKVETSRDLGIGRTRTSKGQFAYEGSGAGRAIKEDGRYIADPNKEFVRTNRIQATRGANILSRQAQTGGEIAQTKEATSSVETFESYSRKFMPKQGD